MNQPEDRPPTGDQPAPSDDLPPQPRLPQEAGDPPSTPPIDLPRSFTSPPPPPPPPPPVPPRAADPAPPPPPAADPAPIPAAAPAYMPPPAPAAPPPPPAPAAAPPPPAPFTSSPVEAFDAPTAEARAASTSTSRPSADDDEDTDDELADYDELDDEPTSRWVSLLATIGTALVAIVSVQVIASVVEGLVLKQGQRVGDIPEDLFHRLGYPFGGLGATALVFLVVGVVLLAMPSVLDEYLSPSQDRVVGIALVVSIVMAIVVAIGSLLAVRANLHEYSAKGVAVPGYVRVQFTNFLLGALGAAALALFASVATMNERARERTG